MKHSLIKAALGGGLAGTVCFALFILVAYKLRDNPFAAEIKAFDFFIYLLVILTTMMVYRFWLNRGSLRFWEGMLLGMSVTTIMLMLSLGWIYVFTRSVAPEVLEIHAQSEIRKFKASKAEFIETWNQQNQNGAEVYEQTLANFQEIDWTIYLIRQELLQKIFAGLIITLISAAVLRK